MITVSKENDGLRVDITFPSPTVYVDYAGIGILARSEDRGRRFRDALLRAGGTLYLSVAHLLELYGLGLGPTYKKMRAFLEGFAANFAMIDCDARAVIEREQAWRPGLQNAVLDVDFIKAVAINWAGDQPLSVGVLLRLVDQDAATLAVIKQLHREHRDNLRRTIENARHAYQQDRKVRANLNSRTYTQVAGTAGTEYLKHQLSRVMIKTPEPFKPSDGIDYEHAVVALAYSDHVVLDKKWAARTTRFPAPTPIAKVWKVGDLESLTQHLARL